MALSKKRSDLFLIILGLFIGASFTGVLWYNSIQKVNVDVYACYYGQPWPWADKMSEALFRVNYDNDKILHYGYRCSLQPSNYTCDPGSTKEYIETREATRTQINDFLNK